MDLAQQRVFITLWIRQIGEFETNTDGVGKFKVINFSIWNVYICMYHEKRVEILNGDFDNQIFIGVLFILPRRHRKIFNSIMTIRNMTNDYSIDLTFS